MGRGKVLEYDDDVLVEMLAGGRHTHAEIAEALGLSEAYVGKVARGERRPKLRRRVEAVQAAMIAEARRVGARWSRALLSRHIEVGLKGDDETARKCRELVLQECCFKRSLSAAEPPGDPDAWQRPPDEEPDDDPLWDGAAVESHRTPPSAAESRPVPAAPQGMARKERSGDSDPTRG